MIYYDDWGDKMNHGQYIAYRVQFQSLLFLRAEGKSRDILRNRNRKIYIKR